MVALTYHAPTTLDEAVSLLSNATLPAKVMSGGTDLIIQMQRMIDSERMIVDVKKIPELATASLSAEGLTLGPALCCSKFTRRDDIKQRFPGLVEAAYLIGSTQVQGRASIGGNLCNASPAADTITALIANSAICRIHGAGGERRIAVEKFVTGVGQNCLEEGELLASIEIPTPVVRTKDAYLRFIPRTEMDIAVAGAAVSVTLDEQGTCIAARVAIGAVAPTALLVPAAAEALVGSRFEEGALAKASAAVSEAASTITDRRGTADFRRHVVGVLTKRAAKIAAERAGEGE